MKQIIEKVCTAKLFEFIIQNDRKLNMEILSGIYPTGTPAVEIIGHLCNYITYISQLNFPNFFVLFKNAYKNYIPYVF